MKRRNFNNSNPQKPHRQVDHFAFESLDVESSPDLTGRIMGRLGYMHASPKAVRRDRLWRWANRSGIAIAAAMAFAIGWKFFESSPDARRTSDLTIPAAISNDLQQQRSRVGNMIRAISNFAPPKFTDEPVSLDELGEPRTIESDFEQPIAAPFRWV